jgi:hypothetical protein
MHAGGSGGSLDGLEAALKGLPADPELPGRRGDPDRPDSFRVGQAGSDEGLLGISDLGLCPVETTMVDGGRQFVEQVQKPEGLLERLFGSGEREKEESRQSNKSPKRGIFRPG